MAVVYIIESKSGTTIPPVLVVAGKPSQALRLFAESLATARPATAFEALTQLEAGAVLLKADPEPQASGATLSDDVGRPLDINELKMAQMSAAERVVSARLASMGLVQAPNPPGVVGLVDSL